MTNRQRSTVIEDRHRMCCIRATHARKPAVAHVMAARGDHSGLDACVTCVVSVVRGSIVIQSAIEVHPIGKQTVKR